MTDLLRRLVSRALGREPVVQPLVGTRFGREPDLLSERSLEIERPPQRALPEGPAAGDEAEPRRD